jgi:uncharacterized protein (UPF0335 family)
MSNEEDKAMTRIAANTIEGRAEPFMKRIENLLDDIDSKRGTYMAEVKEVREDIKNVYTEAKDNGVPVKALRSLIKFRALERKQQALSDGLENEEAQIYEQLRDALGELGAAAADRAGYRESDDDLRTSAEASADSKGDIPEFLQRPQ